MHTEKLAQSVSRLQGRKEAIEKELADVNARIRTIVRILGTDGQAASEAPTSGSAAHAGEMARGAGKPKTAVEKTRKLHRWFEAGEAVSLMKTLVRAPMTASDIVRMLTRAKGHEGKLPPAELKRFQATAYVAVANAVKGGKAIRLKDGRVRIA